VGGPPLPNHPEALRIWLLGGFQVAVGSRRIAATEWRLRKAQNLIKLLALAPGHRLHRDQVLELLWPEAELEAAANNLRRTLHDARRTLAPAPAPPDLAVRFHHQVLALDPPGPLWTDVEAFETAANEARRRRDPAAYLAALDRYGGDLLPEDRYEDWSTARREQLRSLRLELLVEMARLDRAHGKLHPAIEALGLVVAEEPAYEEAYLELMRLHALGGQRHVALRQYQAMARALRQELDAEPSAASKGLLEDIVAGRFPPVEASSDDRAGPAVPSVEAPREQAATAPTVHHNLPSPITSFVGRGREVAEVARLLETARLLTLTGPGGCGKTRLALEVAGKLVGALPHGAWLVELASLADPALVPQAVSVALNARETPGRAPQAALIDALRPKQMLLVLDNCEHLVEACGELVHTLLTACPNLSVIATSRQPLGIIGEVVWRVPPLALPPPERPLPPLDRLAQIEAIQLFVERTRCHQLTFALTRENAPAVAQLCRCLDGLPLALELAAARMQALTPQQLAARLDGRFRLLTGGGHAAPARHQTLRAVVDWSYGLLDTFERTLLDRLSVFAAGWSLEAAEAVGAGEAVGRDGVLDLLSRLVDRSWAVAEVAEDGALRYGMLETLRQYSWERLQERGDVEATRRRHAEYYLALAEEAESALSGPQQAGWLKRLEREHDNLRAALRWAVGGQQSEAALRLAGALGRFWELHGHLSEGQRWLNMALAMEQGGASTPDVRSKTLNGAGNIAARRGEFASATRLFQESLALRRRIGDRRGIAIALNNLGLVAREQGDYSAARACHDESLTLKRDLGDLRGVAIALNNLGIVSRDLGDEATAQACHEESLARFRDLGDSWGIALALNNLGRLARGRADYPLARELHLESLSLRRDLGDRLAISYSLDDVGRLALVEGNHRRAVRLFAAADAVREAIGAPLPPADRDAYERSVSSARVALGDSAFAAAWADGQAMEPERAISSALTPDHEERVP
jgi:predicted ATPase/DNA-binding SARP family transcriptional activator